jgi:hypothetical protein
MRMLNYSDGERHLLGIAIQSGHGLKILAAPAMDAFGAGLLKPV